jgi:hypothetical protein
MQFPKKYRFIVSSLLHIIVLIAIVFSIAFLTRFDFMVMSQGRVQRSQPLGMDI